MHPTSAPRQMIPGKILRFLDEHACVAVAGTRDRALVPHGHQVGGWQVGGDGATMTVSMLGRHAAHLLESLEDNGRLSVTVEEFPSHETYQFKGRYLRHRVVTPADLERSARLQVRFVRALRPMYASLPESRLHEFYGQPTLAVECAVEEIYLQTPGPGAGARLVPPEEALVARAPLHADTGASPRTVASVPSAPLPDAIRPALESGTPSIMVTCSAEGVPNTTIISQVYYVDRAHVALSFQFFSKTIRNVRENPRAFVAVPQMSQGATWALQLAFERSETEGPVFDAMEMQIEAIASATGMSGIFRLRAADIYRVLSVERVAHAD
jgi:uncharacterized protein